MDNKKLLIIGLSSLVFVGMVLLLGYVALQKTVKSKIPPVGNVPTGFPVFPSHIIPKVPSVTPIPTLTNVPNVTPGPSPDTQPVQYVTQVEEENRTKHPDLYLANKLPYTGADFAMDYTVDASGTFTFKVTSQTYSGSELQRKVASWLLGLRLSSDQIATLQIVY